MSGTVSRLQTVAGFQCDCRKKLQRIEKTEVLLENNDVSRKT